jgi:hypothetical protein
MGKDSEQFFRDAQTSFRLAGTAATMNQAERLAEIGRDYLRLARQDAEITTKPLRIASMWPR